MSSLTSLKSDEDADDFIDASSFWMELSTSSVSDTSVPDTSVPDTSVPSTFPVYLGSVSYVDE